MRQHELTRLGYAGLIPFAATAGGVLAAPPIAEASAMTGLCYGAVIASYMAGMGAGGLIVTDKPANRPLLPGMIAALLAWVSVIPSDVIASVAGSAPGSLVAARCGLLIAVFAYLLSIDLAAVRAGGLPDWYAPLRRRLTAGACLSLLVIALGAAAR